ncbi:hypothetical protein BKA93DRAFT_494564 [Sparassis latifolia]
MVSLTSAATPSHVEGEIEEGAYDEEDYDEEYGEGDEEYDDGDDFDAEAEEEMARRLQEQLRADIAKAQLEAAAANAAHSTTPAVLRPTPPALHSAKSSPHSMTKKKEAAIVTMKTILAFGAKDPLVHASLSASAVSAAGDTSVLDMFDHCVASGTLSKKLAKPLSAVVVSLAKSDVLFASLRNSDASALQLSKGKRQREELDTAETGDSRAHKRIAIDQPDLKYRIAEAVQAISRSLSSTTSSSGLQFPDPGLVASIQVPLHQVFLFAVTSSPRGHGGRSPALQELGSLIQMLGVLTGVPIGTGPAPTHPAMYSPGFGAPPDLGTAVYPCTASACMKTFHRLYSLRAHQRLHTLIERPFRCKHCPASFVRNHDLKRHARLHEKKAWLCNGCGKVFSRRDAIKRHKDSRGRGAGKSEGDGVCAYAEIEEVEVEKPEGEEEASRRAKLWNGIADAQDFRTAISEEGSFEEGEVDPRVMEEAQDLVLQLLGLLRSYVGRGQGPAVVPPGPSGFTANVPPATLASVMAGARPSATAQAPVSTSASSSTTLPSSLSLSWLSHEQTKMLEQAIAQAASAAQAQAEAEAALEEGGEGLNDEDDEGCEETE